VGEEVEGSGDGLGGFGEEVDGSGGEDVAVEAGLADVPVEVGWDVVARESGEFGQEDFQDAGGGKRGLGDEQGQEAFWLQAGHPVFEHGAFTRARGPGEEHDAAQGGAGVHEGEGLGLGSAGEDLTGFFVGSEGRTAQSPSTQKFIERDRRFGSGRISAHSCGPGGGFGC
jgi:hypothetical protein